MTIIKTLKAKRLVFNQMLRFIHKWRKQRIHSFFSFLRVSSGNRVHVGSCLLFLLANSRLQLQVEFYASSQWLFINHKRTQPGFFFVPFWGLNMLLGFAKSSEDYFNVSRKTPTTVLQPQTTLTWQHYLFTKWFLLFISLGTLDCFLFARRFVYSAFAFKYFHEWRRLLNEIESLVAKLELLCWLMSHD